MRFDILYYAASSLSEMNHLGKGLWKSVTYTGLESLEYSWGQADDYVRAGFRRNTLVMVLMVLDQGYS